GALAGLLTILQSVILYILDTDKGGWFNLLIFVAILILFITLTIQEHRNKDLNGYINYGRALGTGMLMMVVYCGITTIYYLIYFNVIDTNFIPKMLAESRAKMEEKNLSEEKIEQSMKYTKYFVN